MKHHLNGWCFICLMINTLPVFDILPKIRQMPKIPIFDIVIDDAQTGIYAISLVQYPATEVEWQTFSKETKEKVPTTLSKDRSN